MTTSSGYSRRKQPEQVRRALLDATAHVAVEQGLSALTVQAVAAAAGVTKGGLFHHFPNKGALVEAMLADLLDRFDAEIDRRMAEDTEAHGRFTRAYIDTFLLERFGVGAPFTGLAATLIAEPSLGHFWRAWIDGRMARHRDTDADPMLEIVRLAVDGALLAHLSDSLRPTPQALRDQLLRLTQEMATASESE